MYLFTLEQPIPQSYFDFLLEACNYVNNVSTIPIVDVGLKQNVTYTEGHHVTALIHYNKPKDLFTLVYFFGMYVQRHLTIIGHA